MLLSYVTDLIQAYGLPLLFLILTVENTFLGLVIPGELILFSAAALAGSRDLNVYALFFVALAAGFLGNTISYFVGRKAGISLLERFSKKTHSKKLLERSEAFFKKHGAVTLLVGRFAISIRVFISPLAGISKMRFGLFFAYTSISLIVWTLLIILLGFFFGRNLDVLLRNFNLFAIIVLVIIIVIFIIFYLRKRKNAREDSKGTEKK